MSEKIEIKLAENLNRLARTKNLTQSSIAYRTGISTSSLHSYFVGVEPKSIVALKKIADYFEMSLDELVFNSSSSKNKKEMSLIEERYEVIIRKQK